jgi:hypothetical protein
MGQIIFHVGLPKTASTSLQLYFDSIDVNHVKYDRYFNKEYFDKDKEYSGINSPTVFSDENYLRYSFFLGYEFFLEKAKQEFENIKIIIVTRNQLDFLRSIFKHSIKVGYNYNDFNDFLKSNLGVDAIRMCMFYSIYTNTLRFIPKKDILIIPFESIKETDNFIDTILDFMNYEGKRIYKLPHSNKNLSENELFLLNKFRLINIFSKTNMLGKSEDVFKKGVVRLTIYIFPKLFYKKANEFFNLNKDTHHKMLLEFEKQNDKLKRVLE